jgi:membrane associated rhomboid family serine protease
MLPLKDRNPTSRPAVLTIALIVVNVAVFVLLQQGSEGSTFTYAHAAVPCEVTARCSYPQAVSPWLTLVWSMFMHGGWLHLAGNMWFLWIFGNNIEDQLGAVKYLVFYLLGGAVAALAHIYVRPSSDVPMVGASGAIAAVMGAYFVWFPRAPIKTVIFFFLLWIRDIQAKWLLLFWLGLQFVTGPGSSVAWMAHVGGFVFGALVAYLIRSVVPVRHAILKNPPVGQWDTTGRDSVAGRFENPPPDPWGRGDWYGR